MKAKVTKHSLETEIAAVEAMDIQALQARWREVFKIAPPFKVRAGFLRRALAYRLQEQVFGGLKPASARMLHRIAAADRAARADKVISGTGAVGGGIASVIGRKRLALAPGAQLVREWDGKAETVTVVADGYAWRGRTFKTLTGAANAITGGRWSGPRFFGLLAKPGATPALADAHRASALGEPIALPAPTTLETV